MSKRSENIILIFFPIVFLLYSLIWLNIGISFYTSLIGLYLFSHLVKIVRVVFIFQDHEIRLRDAVYFQFISNLASLILPFRLGDIYRIFVFASITGPKKSILGVLIEKIFDFLILTIIAIGTCISFKLDLNLALVGLAVICFFIAYTYYFLEDNIVILKRILILRKHNNFLSKFYLLLSSVESYFVSFKEMTNRKIAVLALLTVIIWILEFSALFCLVKEIGVNVEIYKVIEFLSPTNIANRLGSFSTSQWQEVYFKNLILVAFVMNLFALGFGFMKRGKK